MVRVLRLLRTLTYWDTPIITSQEAPLGDLKKGYHCDVIHIHTHGFIFMIISQPSAHDKEITGNSM